MTGLIGLVVDATTGNPIQGVTVAAGTLTTTTDSQGNFAMPTIPNGTSVVSFTAPVSGSLAPYAPQSRTVQIIPTIETSVIVQMTPNGTTSPATFDPTVGATLTVTGSTAQAVISGGSLRDASGNPPAAALVNDVVTPLASSLDPYLLPGEYVVSPTSAFETFGGVDLRVDDNLLNQMTGALAGPGAIQIPVSSRAAAPPASVSLFRFDPTTGLWVQDGTATLQGAAPNQFYGGAISRVAAWAAGQVYTASTISVCVQDPSGAPVVGARVQSDGIDYSGGGTGWTNSSGVASVPMKQGGSAIITATSPRSSSSATISNAQSASNFTLTPCLIMPTRGMTMRLTWGALPLDLDSHLKEPNSVHIAYFSRGSLGSPPYAALDVDDVTSFGPEVITVLRLTQGVNEYFVHNFSGTFAPGMTGSPARVEVRVGSQTRIFTPPAGEGTNPYWRVFQFTVATDCSVTIAPVQQWAATEPPNPAGTASGTICN
ncbi:MAG TPA: hypothetical protein VEU32_11655 [Burkholderiales bacterium]|nr:hypothetical protein [Burkholderiales bacterium]